jgi:hypothetical protein
MAALSRLTSEEKDLIAFGRLQSADLAFLTGILLTLETKPNKELNPDERFLFVYDKLNILHQKLNLLYTEKFKGCNRNYHQLELNDKVIQLRTLAQAHIQIFF